MKRYGILLVLGMALYAFSVVQAQPDTLTLLHVNDTHSHLLPYGPKDMAGNWTWGGMARVATLVGMTRMTEPNVMLFHSGDLFVGDFMFQEYVGVAELEIMKAIGYNAMELGNHEFDLYPSTLKYVLNQAGFPTQGFPVLCANLDITNDTEMGYFVRPYSITEIGGLTIGILGLVTELTNQISNPSPLVITPPSSCAQTWVDSLRIGHGCDLVILLSHMGVFEDQMVAAATSGIDLILGGHTHTSLPTPIQIGNTLIVQAGEFASHLGKMTLYVDGGAVTGWNYDYLTVDSSVPEEPNLAAMINMLAMGIEADPRFGPVYTETVGTAARNLDKPLGEGICKDNPLGNLVADAMRAITGTEIAIAPQGFISQTIYAGPIKGADIFQAVPYGFDQVSGLGLKLATFETNGISLIGGLEFATYNLPYVEDFFLHGSNFSYVYNLANLPGSRVDWGSITINGQPLDPYGIYSVTVPDAVVPFFSQIPGFEVNNLVFTDYFMYSVTRDFIIANSPIAYYSEGRVLDASHLAEPISGTDALIDVVTLFRENRSITMQAVADKLRQKLQLVRASLERGQIRAATMQLNEFKIRVDVFQNFGLISVASEQRLIYLAHHLQNSIDQHFNKFAGGNMDPVLPSEFMLAQNYPNPFNPETRIEYSLPGPSDVNLAVFDVQGRKVRVLVDGQQDAGIKVVTWNGCDENGSRVSSGVYFYRLQAGDYAETKKMVLEK